jgi:CRP-like cAMP-binding protein
VKAKLFEDMALTDIQRFLDACTLSTVTSGSTVLTQGREVEAMVLIAHGCIEVSLRNDEGHVAIIHHAREGETLGEIEAISREPCLAECAAVGPSIVLLCPVPLLSEHLSNPLIQRNVMRITRERLLRDNQRKYVDQNYPLDRRLCAYLLRLADRNNRVQQSQSYIAHLASCSRQSINRGLATLREDGLITIEKGKIRLLERDRLERRLAGETEDKITPATE